ncbi:MAG: hypothetical protein V1844_09885 [Pseudomonadota bacterium]
MQTSGLISHKNVAYYEYNHTKHGGAVGAIPVPGDVIPKGAIIKEGLLHIKDACTSAATTCTLGVSALTTSDILAPAAVSTLTPENTLLATVPVGTAATAIRVTEDITELEFNVGVVPLTGGKIVAALEYIVTD